MQKIEYLLGKKVNTADSSELKTPEVKRNEGQNVT